MRLSTGGMLKFGLCFIKVQPRRLDIVESRREADCGVDMDNRAKRRIFLRNLVSSLQMVWPVVSAVLVLIVGLGILVGVREGWSFQESIYFSFVTGLTIGYGDLAPKTLLGRLLAILIGMCGVILTGLIAAIAVKAITDVRATTDE